MSIFGGNRRAFVPALVVAATLLSLTLIVDLGSRLLPDHVVATINDRPITRARFTNELRLDAVRRVLSDRVGEPISQAAMLNRLIGDMLLLQAAEEAGLNVETVELDAEIDGLLDRYGYTRGDMDQILGEYDLPWPVFEDSVRQYMLMNRFVEEMLLADLTITQRQTALGDWMTGQVEAAHMTFDPLFLAGINRPGASPPLPR